MWQNPRSINNNYFPPPLYQSTAAPVQQPQQQGNGWQQNNHSQYPAAGGQQSAHHGGQPPRQQRRLEGTPQNTSNANFPQSGPPPPRVAPAPLHVGHQHQPLRQAPQFSAPQSENRYVPRVPHIHPVHSPAPPTTNDHEDHAQTKKVVSATQPPTETPTEAQYLQFLQTKKSEMMCRGTFFLANHKRRNAALPPSTGPKTVNIDQWNQYWEAFSDEVSDYETVVRQILEHQEVPRSIAPPGASREGDAVARQNRRRVIVKISGGNGHDIYADVVRLALRFGVLESVKVKHDEFRVQFTTSSAAFAYASCVKCTPRSITLPSMYKHDVSGQCLHAFFVEQRAALDANPPPSVLVLSNLADMPTVFLTALFRDCYDATDVRYVQQPQRRDSHPPHAAQPLSPSGGSSSSVFHIHFQNYQAAKYALHVLQQSFFEVFELSLTFLGVSEQLDLGVAL